MAGSSIFPVRSIILFVATLVGFALAAAQVHAADREWTVMVYMNGKNNLEPDALNNFVAMSNVGSTDKVAVVTELGRPKTHWTTDFDEWSGVYRFYVQKGTNPIPNEAAVDVAALGESTDMGKTETLSSFVNWAKKTYPANHYMLVIWNHGQGYRFQLSAFELSKRRSRRIPPPRDIQMGGFRAVSSDEDTGSILYNSEVADVVRTNFSTDKLDILGFDACLMSMIETAYAFTPTTKIMIGSEELEPSDGWQYQDWLSRLIAAPQMSGQEVGEAVVDSYRDHYGDGYLTTLSTVDLSLVSPVSRKISTFADGVRAAGPPEIKLLAAARAELRSYASSINPPPRTSVDLIALLEHYQAKTKNSALAAQAASIVIDLRTLVLSNYASSRSEKPSVGLPYGSQGIAIYFPETKAAFLNDGFHKGYLKANKDHPIAFVQNETWAELLYATLDIK